MKFLDIWYLTRASGLVAYFLLFMAISLGLIIQIQRQRKKSVWLWPIIHQAIGNWAMYLSLFHVGILLFDNYLKLTWSELFIPFVSNYHMFPLAFGIIGLYGLVAVIISSDFRQQIGTFLWRKIHILSPLTYILVTFHGIFIGTDATHAIPQILYGGSALLVSLLAILRLSMEIPGAIVEKR
ncbi:hypothetical protein ACQCN2_10580 [Brevibacillus ginsengisoli]|uniref:hypothetical protein n=1 Tax=Brevibacillus ginsengisoli TaxID=363854 RepID=UPI003CED80F3